HHGVTVAAAWKRGRSSARSAPPHVDASSRTVDEPIPRRRSSHGASTTAGAVDGTAVGVVDAAGAPVDELDAASLAAGLSADGAVSSGLGPKNRDHTTNTTMHSAIAAKARRSLGSFTAWVPAAGAARGRARPRGRDGNGRRA